VSNNPIHLLVRFSDHLLSDSDTITEHNQVVSSHGAVWFGKMGARIGYNHIERLNTQINDGVPTYLLLVKGNRKKSTFFKADLLSIGRQFPDTETEFIPEYYKELDIIQFMKTWIKIKEIQMISSDEINKFRVASSVFPIEETLFKSSSGHFLIKALT
jgi:hypothetical protein